MPGRSENTRNVRAGKVRPQRHDVAVACTCTCRMRRGREGPGTTMAYRAWRVRRCHMLGWQPGTGLQWWVLLLSCSGINLRHCTQPQKVGDGGGNALHHHILHIIHLRSSLLRFIDIHQHLASRCQHRSLFTYFHTLWTVCLSSVIVEECAEVQRKAKCCCRCGSWDNALSARVLTLLHNHSLTTSPPYSVLSLKERVIIIWDGSAFLIPVLNKLLLRKVKH